METRLHTSNADDLLDERRLLALVLFGDVLVLVGECFQGLGGKVDTLTSIFELDVGLLALDRRALLRIPKEASDHCSALQSINVDSPSSSA